MSPEQRLEHLVQLADGLFAAYHGERDIDECMEDLAGLCTGVHELVAWVRDGQPSRIPWASPAEENSERLVKAIRGILTDIYEVLERVGEHWWDDTVTSGTHHRTEAEKLSGE